MGPLAAPDPDAGNIQARHSLAVLRRAFAGGRDGFLGTLRQLFASGIPLSPVGDWGGGEWAGHDYLACVIQYKLCRNILTNPGLLLGLCLWATTLPAGPMTVNMGCTKPRGRGRGPWWHSRSTSYGYVSWTTNPGYPSRRVVKQTHSPWSTESVRRACVEVPGAAGQGGHPQGVRGGEGKNSPNYPVHTQHLLILLGSPM